MSQQAAELWFVTYEDTRITNRVFAFAKHLAGPWPPAPCQHEMLPVAAFSWLLE
jgi:hypothetical protein